MAFSATIVFETELNQVSGVLVLGCKCGGILLVIVIEKPPAHLSKTEKLKYNRVCDVECQKCGEIYYSQPYDDGKALNPLRPTKKI